jgi:D-3-phosphoglycerate dehydrogenase
VSELNTQPVTRSLVKGFLERISGRVNEVNALSVASGLGMKVEEMRTASTSDFSELIQIVARAGQEEVSIAGTFFGSTNNPRLVRINGFPVEATPQGVLCIMENLDKPGIIGWVGTIFGKHRVNIANMSLSRDRAGGNALTVLNLDEVPDNKIITEIMPNPDIKWIKVVKVS